MSLSFKLKSLDLKKHICINGVHNKVVTGIWHLGISSKCRSSNNWVTYHGCSARWCRHIVCVVYEPSNILPNIRCELNVRMTNRLTLFLSLLIQWYVRSPHRPFLPAASFCTSSCGLQTHELRMSGHRYHTAHFLMFDELLASLSVRWRKQMGRYLVCQCMQE